MTKEVKFTGKRVFELIKQFHNRVDNTVSNSKVVLTNDEMIDTLKTDFTKEELTAMLFGMDITIQKMVNEQVVKDKYNLKTDMAFQ